jgi:hypothetical protein
MPLRLATKFLSFVGSGQTKPFLIQDKDGIKWVVKALGNPFGTQAVFNEHVAGGLAHLIGLSWPKTSLITLSQEIKEELEARNFHASSSIAIGGQFIDGLRAVNAPPFTFDLEFAKINGKYIRSTFPQYIHAFYGKSIFDNWVLMKDTKPDTLHMYPDGSPIFLDATFAFGYVHDEWDIGRLSWNESDFNLDPSPYLRGVVVDPGQFAPWITKIQNVSHEELQSLLNSIPDDWNVPPEYVEALETFLLNTSQVFVPPFREWLEYLRWT